MSEIITVSPRGKPNNISGVDRDNYYTTAFDGTISSEDLDSVHVVAVILVNREGQLMLQKRSPTKRHNARMIDKSIAGHIVYGDSADYTVMLESIQELLTPSIVLSNKSDFDKTLNLLSEYLRTVSLVHYVDTVELKLDKKVSENVITVPNVVHLYFGVYEGSTRPADKEASGVLYYSLEDIQEEKSTSNLFTHDLLILLDKYEDKLKEFISSLR